MDQIAVEVIDLPLAVQHLAIRGVKPLDAAFAAQQLILGIEPLAVGIPPLVEAAFRSAVVVPEPLGVHRSTSS
ncbi:hypothetical protein D3C80_2144800 [compost metagenome]